MVSFFPFIAVAQIFTAVVLARFGMAAHVDEAAAADRRGGGEVFMEAAGVKDPAAERAEGDLDQRAQRLPAVALPLPVLGDAQPGLVPLAGRDLPHPAEADRLVGLPEADEIGVIIALIGHRALHARLRVLPRERRRPKHHRGQAFVAPDAGPDEVKVPLLRLAQDQPFGFDAFDHSASPLYVLKPCTAASVDRRQNRK